jgi:hypothetical protein
LGNKVPLERPGNGDDAMKTITSEEITELAEQAYANIKASRGGTFLGN